MLKQCVNINCQMKDKCGKFIHYSELKAKSETERLSLKKLAEAQPKRYNCLAFEKKNFNYINFN